MAAGARAGPHFHKGDQNMKFKLRSVPYVGIALHLGKYSYVMSVAQSTALRAFCECPELGSNEALSLASGTKSGVEVASCGDGLYTVLFTVGEEVEGEMVGTQDLRALGQLLGDFKP